MSIDINNIEVGTVVVSTVDGEDFYEGKFDPEASRFVYVPEENSERPWRVQNPGFMALIFFGPGPHYFGHEGDIADRIEEGTVRTLTAEEAEIAAAHDAERAEAL